jgi:hypothetical protein
MSNLSHVIDVDDRSAPLAIQDRAERIATAILQILTAQPKITTSELRPRFVAMLRDEIAEIERRVAGDIPQSERC